MYKTVQHRHSSIAAQQTVGKSKKRDIQNQKRKLSSGQRGEEIKKDIKDITQAKIVQKSSEDSSAEFRRQFRLSIAVQSTQIRTQN